MKTANYLFTVLTLSILLFTTGCGTHSSKSAEPETPPVITNTPAPTPDTTDSSNKENSHHKGYTSNKETSSNKKDSSIPEPYSKKELNDIYEKEREIFETHREIWDKVFTLVDKNTTKDNQDMDYTDFLTRTIEDHEDSFTETEHKLLKEDIKKLKAIIQGEK